ncbi:MAG: ATP-dependent RNA helicase HrpA, partial [Gammaproteobacteria bacterium]
GIRYVVDSGLVRISRYSVRSKVQRLPIEPVSQASANQRAGRCGRVGPGICIRLYSEEDFRSRPAFTDPEIRRTNLAGVILQMVDRGLGQIEDFPFLDPPDPRQVRDGYRTLVEIGALDEGHRITAIGRRLARLPLDVRIGRMLLAAEQEGCLEEVAIIASALSVQDPREFSPEDPGQARRKHALFADARSDFIGWLKLWGAWREQARHLSGSKLRRWCREHWLSWMRMREWQDIHRQIRELLADMGVKFNTRPADYDAIHRALIAGLPGQVARHEEGTEYRGARDLRLHLFPGTGIQGRPKWILAAEIVETSRRFARTVAAIRPEWVEQAVPHLLKRTRTEPHWDRRAGRVVARETVSLYGLVLASGRRVDYGRIDPEGARALFVREAIAACDLRREWPFQRHNRELVASVQEQEARQRRPDLFVGTERLAARFDALLPARIHCERDFNRWYARLPAAEQQRWFLAPEDVRRETATPGEGFPDVFQLDGLALPLRYHLAPGEEDDGVTVQVPLALLPQLSPEPFEWLVPGLLEEKVQSLIRSLPKSLRRHFVPAPDFARAALEAMPRTGSLRAALARELERMTGVAVPEDAWREELLAPHLHMRFAVLDAEGHEIAAGRDLLALQRELANEAVHAFRNSAREVSFQERESITSWDFGDLPESVEQEQAGIRLRAWPALVREGDRVALRLLPEAEAARRAHRQGLVALFMQVERRRFRTLARQLPEFDRMALALSSLMPAERLRTDLLWRIAEEALGEALESEIRTREAFEDAVRQAAPRLMETANRLCRPLAEAAALWHGLRKQLTGRVPPAWLAALADMRSQLDLLVYPDFLRELPTGRLFHLPRYLRGLALRLERLENDPARDAQRQRQVEPWWETCRKRIEAHGRAEVQHWPCRWLVEEYRISLFAQSLGTAEKVSPERLRKACN